MKLSPPQHHQYAESCILFHPARENIGILGSDPSLFLVQRLDVVKDLPPMFILHRKVKSAVPYQSSEAFVKKSMVTHPDVKVLHTVVPGKEHGIDLRLVLILLG
jgi:hypothetical protein